jgi:hypothetical protein
MKYTVIWRPEAIQELADIWMRSANRDAVSVATRRIDQHLREEVSNAGQTHYDPTRILIVPPLVALFEISNFDRQAVVLSVFERY